jgi:predicted DCC family thiol-disulfide oxidoreductase YuxK
MKPATRTPTAVALPQRLVLYDGVCGFCDWLVQWLLAKDRDGRLSFAPLQGETAAFLRSRHATVPVATETMVYVESGEGHEERVYLRSEAAFKTCAELPHPWRWIAWLRVLPRPLTDLGYRGFAAIRYRIFGKLDACKVPATSERQRFLP